MWTRCDLPIHRFLGAGVLLLASTAGAAGGASGSAGLAVTDPPRDLSAGYVDDAVCATCHATLAVSYSQVGMSRAFGDARSSEQIETFSTPQDPEAGRFYHRPSDRWYEMRRSSPDSRPLFRRWQVDWEGHEAHVFEAEVDWVLGSGHTSRSYLLHQPGGELFVLPVAWYSQGGHWGMAPGFDEEAHLGLQRRVQRQCMFCHNAYPPDVEVQADRPADPHLFPRDLPHGIGCQRCHGPGARHVEAAYLGGLSDDHATSAIVNPARLEPRLRDDVCEQCHLQPSVAFMPMRRFGRRVYSYRPGEDLDEYIVYFDPQEESAERGERFEINHHPYRLRQSTCFTQSPPGSLSCLTCHDPHRKVPAQQRVAHYQQACRSCHEVDACGLEQMVAQRTAQSAGVGSVAALPLHMRGVDPADCTTCHMPRRRTRDVVHVVMTDHRIDRLPGGEAPDLSLTAPLEEFTPTLVDLEFYLPESAPTGVLGEVYRAVGVELIGGNESSFAHLERMLPASGTTAKEPWLQLARGYLSRRQRGELEHTLRQVLTHEPDTSRALQWLGLANSESDPETAAAHLETARRISRFEEPDLLYNLGVVYLYAGRLEDAKAALKRCVDLRPLHAAGWLQLGVVLDRLEDPAAAIDALRRSLAIEPRTPRPRTELARILHRQGQGEEAVRLLRQGLRWSDDPEAMAHALAGLREVAGEVKSSHGSGAGPDRRPKRNR